MLWLCLVLLISILDEIVCSIIVVTHETIALWRRRYEILISHFVGHVPYMIQQQANLSKDLKTIEQKDLS